MQHSYGNTGGHWLQREEVVMFLLQGAHFVSKVTHQCPPPPPDLSSSLKQNTR